METIWETDTEVVEPPNPPDPPDLQTKIETSTKPEMKVKKLTEFFNKLGGEPSKKKTPVKKDNGSITKRKWKQKIEEPQKAKMETALRKYLTSVKEIPKDPDKEYRNVQ